MESLTGVGSPEVDPRIDYVRANSERWQDSLRKAIDECDNNGQYHGRSIPLVFGEVLAPYLSPRITDRPNQLVALGLDFRDTLSLSFDGDQRTIGTMLATNIVRSGRINVRDVLTNLSAWISSCSGSGESPQ